MAESKGQAWFCVTGLPSDVEIEVDDMSFHFHKYPFMSKSKKFDELITQQEQNPRNLDEEDEDAEIEEFGIPKISLANFPGGPETFETAAKFCYGVKINLNSSNAAALRCAAEYLEMTEEFSEQNLISLTERFLEQSVFKNLRSSLKALKSCENLSPLAETLGIVQRCIDSIAHKAKKASHSGSFYGWPIASADGRKINGGSEPWFEDLTDLSLPIFKRVIAAMKGKDLSSKIIEGSLIAYAKRSIPGLSRSSGHLVPPLEIDQKELLETLITTLPSERSSSTSSTRFLFRLLRTISILKGSESSRAELERKIALRLENAAVDDLLIPSYSYTVETLYDVESVERILGYYLEGIGELAARSPGGENNGTGGGGGGGGGLVRVGRLVDGYLAEIASDANLRPEKFCTLATALPDRARVYDDGLYRAVDLYLKAHPRISPEERDKICSVMDCRKLTLEACTHAAQNERLPLRAVVQVLFFEQLQLRHAISSTLIAANPMAAAEGQHSGAFGHRESATWQTAIRENQVLKLDMDSIQSRVKELEGQCSMMKRALEKAERKEARVGSDRSSSVGSKYGCKFGTKVCDSQERTVMEPRKSQTGLHQPSP